MIATARRDSENLAQFHKVVKRAYETEKNAGNIPAQDISVYDKLVACPAVVHPKTYGRNTGWVRPVHAHRHWRRRVASMYRRENGRGGLFTGWFDWDIDWEEIWNWILENIIPILKLLLVIVPFII